MTAPGTHEARDVLDEYRQVVGSMISDQDKFDAPLVRMWVALREALNAAESFYKWGNEMRALEKLVDQEKK